jgi:hypothetical protein
VIRQIERNVVPTSDEAVSELDHPAHAAESPEMRLEESDSEAASGALHGP